MREPPRLSGTPFPSAPLSRPLWVWELLPHPPLLPACHKQSASATGAPCSVGICSTQSLLPSRPTPTVREGPQWAGLGQAAVRKPRESPVELGPPAPPELSPTLPVAPKLSRHETTRALICLCLGLGVGGEWPSPRAPNKSLCWRPSGPLMADCASEAGREVWAVWGYEAVVIPGNESMSNRKCHQCPFRCQCVWAAAGHGFLSSQCGFRAT